MDARESATAKTLGRLVSAKDISGLCLLRTALHLAHLARSDLEPLSRNQCFAVAPILDDRLLEPGLRTVRVIGDDDL
jgi:hypothetical protein